MVVHFNEPLAMHSTSPGPTAMDQRQVSSLTA